MESLLAEIVGVLPM